MIVVTGEIETSQLCERTVFLVFIMSFIKSVPINPRQSFHVECDRRENYFHQGMVRFLSSRNSLYGSVYRRHSEDHLKN